LSLSSAPESKAGTLKSLNAQKAAEKAVRIKGIHSFSSAAFCAFSGFCDCLWARRDEAGRWGSLNPFDL
jgi:hypothetical protein